MKPSLKKLQEAAQNADWVQVSLNCSYGPPCFHFEPERGRFCLRAKGWHDKTATEMFHAFLPLEQLIDNVATKTK